MAGADGDFLTHSGIAHFDPMGDASTVSVKWKAWLEEFESYAESRGLFLDTGTVEQKAQRRALLRFTVGPAVRETFKTLLNTGRKDEYQKAVDALNAHYVVTQNATFQRHLFRRTRQEDGQTIAQYVTRLHQLAVGCNYMPADLNNQLLDQVVQHCRSDKLRRRLLERGSELELTDALTIAAALEAVEGQFHTMTLKDNSSQQIKRLSHRHNQPRYTSTHDVECYRCGNRGHFGKDPYCPAKGKVCRKCGGKDHFAKKCKSKSNADQKRKSTTSKGKAWGKGKYPGKKDTIRQIDGDDDDTQEGQSCYQFTLNDVRHEKVSVIIGGVTVQVIADSGSDSNVIDRHLWEKLKRKNIICTSKKCSKKLYPYTATKPLQTIRCFTATVEVGDKYTEAEFMVIEERGEPLLS
ncbi:uncharacterized protein [Narcine bancroftii]|uniref:uncharacterized protein isoform X1 n=1 Tax=Narcine bancroftii TaxID=1343680 RepID=UPI003831FAA2